jgi:hypothetical protein
MTPNISIMPLFIVAIVFTRVAIKTTLVNPAKKLMAPSIG